MNRLMTLLEKHGACSEARAWCKGYKSPSAAWLACKNPDWMLWALDELGLYNQKKVRLFAC